MNLKRFALSAATAVMFGSFAFAQGPAPEPKEGDRPEPPRPEVSENQPENEGPAIIQEEGGPEEACPMPPREGEGEFKPGDHPFPPMPPHHG